jgi:anti-anti-sigma regulatory factor
MNHARADGGLSISQRPVTPWFRLVRFGGDLTAGSASTLAGWVAQICAGPIRAIHVDVSRLDYIDDAGAWTLALAFQCVRFHGHGVSIYNVPFPLRCILDAVLTRPDSPPGPPPGPPGPPARTSPPQLIAGDGFAIAADTSPRGWLAMDLRVCSEDPQLASMFAIFDLLGDGQGSPGKAVLSPRSEIPGWP